MPISPLRLAQTRGELERTIARFNETAVKGEDPEFGKGTTSYNRSLGDPDHGPNPCLAPIEKGPYFARSGFMWVTWARFAGLKANENAQVLDRDGRPIPGLYSAGKRRPRRSWGGNYPGGGITLGPAITFGWIAARHMAGAND